MTTVLLLHSALGMRPAVGDFADRLRSGGHEVLTPDYYDGQVFDTEESGILYRDQIGPKELLARVRGRLDELPEDAALAGFSLGAAFAQRLAAERPAARGVFLLHHVGVPRGPWSGQPVQVHRYADDPWIDTGDVTAMHRAVTASGASFEDFVLPGSGHLFTDAQLPDGDPAATARTADRMGELLDRATVAGSVGPGRHGGSSTDGEARPSPGSTGG